MLDITDIESTYDLDSEQGRNPIHPKTFIKVGLYALYNCRFSLRKMQEDIENHLGYKWLTGDKAIDHSTIGKFYARYLDEIVELFSQVVTICKKQDLIDFDILAIDSMKLRANASHKQSKSLESIAKEVARIFMAEVPKYKTTRYGRGPIGCVFLPDWASVSSNVPWGFVIGATPDGRKSEDPTADVESADMGTDINGPTALIKSVANIDHILLSDGAIFNLRFSPTVFEDERKIKKLIALIRTYFDLDGMQMQFNVVSTETLRDAHT